MDLFFPRTFFNGLVEIYDQSFLCIPTVPVYGTDIPVQDILRSYVVVKEFKSFRYDSHIGDIRVLVTRLARSPETEKLFAKCQGMFVRIKNKMILGRNMPSTRIQD